MVAAIPIHLVIVDEDETITGAELPQAGYPKMVSPRVLLAGTNCGTTDGGCRYVVRLHGGARHGVVARCDSTLKLAGALDLGERDLKQVEVIGGPVQQPRLASPNTWYRVSCPPEPVKRFIGLAVERTPAIISPKCLIRICTATQVCHPAEDCELPSGPGTDTRLLESPEHLFMMKTGTHLAREVLDLPVLWKSQSWRSLPQSGTAAYRALVLALVCHFALATFPPVPPPGSSLDASWVTALNMAHTQGLVAGRDWVSTYGPLEYLTAPEPESGEFALGLVYRLSISLVWCVILFVLTLRASSTALGLWLLAVFGIVAVIDDYMYVDRLELTIAAMALPPSGDPTRWRCL
jgi:hypothetical protein